MCDLVLNCNNVGTWPKLQLVLLLLFPVLYSVPSSEGGNKICLCKMNLVTFTQSAIPE